MSVSVHHLLRNFDFKKLVVFSKIARDLLKKKLPYELTRKFESEFEKSENPERVTETSITTVVEGQTRGRKTRFGLQAQSQPGQMRL